MGRGAGHQGRVGMPGRAGQLLHRELRRAETYPQRKGEFERSIETFGIDSWGFRARDPSGGR